MSKVYKLCNLEILQTIDDKTTPRFLRQAANRMLPPGLWYSTASLAECLDYESYHKIKSGSVRVDCRYWPERSKYYVSAAICRELLGYDLTIDPSAVDWVRHCLKEIGVATI